MRECTSFQQGNESLAPSTTVNAALARTSDTATRIRAELPRFDFRHSHLKSHRSVFYFIKNEQKKIDFSKIFEHFY